MGLFGDTPGLAIQMAKGSSTIKRTLHPDFDLELLKFVF